MIERIYQMVERVPRGKRLIAIAFVLGVVSAFFGCAPGVGAAGGSGDMVYLGNQLINGLALGCIYALIALGYTMVYAVIEVLHFAHADIFMVGSYMAYFGIRFGLQKFHLQGDMPLWAVLAGATVFAMLVCGVLGFIIEKLAYRPLREAASVSGLIAAIGLSILLQNLGIITFSADTRSFQPQGFALYKVQVADSEEFTDPETYEVTNERIWYAPEELMGENFFVRVQPVTKKGEGPFSQPIEITPDRRQFYKDLEPKTSEAGLVSTDFLSYSTTEQGGRETVSVSWEELGLSAKSIPPLVGEQSYVLYSAGPDSRITISRVQVIMLIATGILLAVLFFLLYRTRLGTALRGVSMDPMATKLMGVNSDGVISFTFFIVSASAALAGVLWGLYLSNLEPLMGLFPGLKSIIAAVVGGMGSVPGAALGGVVLGVIENIVKGYIPDQLSPLADAIAFALLILILLWRPRGLLGGPETGEEA